MVSFQPVKQIAALSIALGLTAQLLAPAMAGNEFGVDWQAKPLVDPNAAKPSAPATPSISAKPAPVQPDQAALEAKLKPAEPFIASVEKKLLLKPEVGSSLVNRLNELQSVLFGAQQHQDAGELLAQLATLFPEEAAKAHADLTAKMQSSLPQASASAAPPDASKTANSGKKQVVTPQPIASANPAQPTYSPSGFGNYATPSVQPAKKKRFWEAEDDPFKNDPFFQDQPTSSYNQSQPGGASKLGGIGQGLAGLAMMAGSVAGTYYLNKNSGNGLGYPQNGYYNSPYNGYGYPNNGYGYPNGYGGYGQGYPQTGYAPPYGYGGYAAPPFYGNPYGVGPTTVTTKPYQPYGTSTFGSISPLGVPTGF